MSGLQIRLSGQVQVIRDGEPVTLPGQRARALVVLLGLSAGRRVSSDELVLRVWGEDPPANPRASLYTNIARLRRAVGEDRVSTNMDGYVLAVPRAEVDLLAFQDILDGAQTVPGDERARLQAALDLWQGEPFGGAPSEWIEQQLVSPWVERYLSAYERLVDLDLEDGCAAGHIPHLRDLVDQHPLRETLWARLLSALQHGGRTAEALERYDTLRRLLVEDLGADPSPELQGLHQRLLAAEPPEEVTVRRGPRVPHMLPSDVDGFTGRGVELEMLDDAVAAGVRTVAVHGPGGVGKTSLAIHWARRIGEQLPDGELFVDLRGYGPGEPTSVMEALDQMLRGIGVAGAEIPDNEDGRAALLRSRMTDRCMLVLLDNARASQQVRPLLPGGKSIVVVTSRSQLRGLVSRSGARRIRVDPMPTPDAISLLQQRIGPIDDSAADQLGELAERCGRLPVALAVAAERAGRDGEVRLASMLDRLRDDQWRIATLTDWDDDPLTGVRDVFAWSYEVLDADTARVFQLLGLMPDSVISVGAASALAGAEVPAVERLLDRLTDTHLVSETRVGWYALHDLSRAYAGEVATALGPDERDAAVRRLRNWYAHSCRNATNAIRLPIVEPPVLALEDGVHPVEFPPDGDAAVSWLHDHQRSLRAVFASAVADGDHTVVVAVALAENSFLRDTVVALAEAGTMARLAYRSAEALDDPVARAVCATRLGLWAAETGDHDTAMEYLTRARDLFSATGYEAGRLTAETNICSLLTQLDQLGDAVEQLQSALNAERFSPELAHVRVRMENNLADGYLQLGRPADALETARTAVEHARQAPWLDADLATVLITLGEAQQASANWAQSVETLLEAKTWCRRGASRRYEIIVLKLLGLAYRTLGNHDLAREQWERAAELLEGSEVLRAYGVSSEDLRRLISALPDDA